MNAPVIAFSIYFSIGILLIVVAVAKHGRERKTKGFEPGASGDVVDAWLLIFMALLWPVWLLLSLGKKKAPGDRVPPRSAASSDPSYAERLNNTKEFFPFSLWATYEELEQYTEENCAEAEAILDRLITRLAALGEGASEAAKLQAFQEAVEALNVLNDENNGNLIETGEREELCDLFNRIAAVAGLDRAKYGQGEGVASMWRDW